MLSNSASICEAASAHQSDLLAEAAHYRVVAAATGRPGAASNRSSMIRLGLAYALLALVLLALMIGTDSRPATAGRHGVYPTAAPTPMLSVESNPPAR